MGIKKRGLNSSLDGSEDQIDTTTSKEVEEANRVVSKPSEKVKKQKEEVVEDEMEEEEADKIVSKPSKKVNKQKEVEDGASKGEEEEGADKVVSKLSKKGKKQKEEVVDDKTEDGAAQPTSALPTSVKPMERKKKRKTMDKERHRTSSTDVDVPKLEKNSINADAPPPLASSNNVSSLPEFHISVFKDLGSADSSAREAAAEALVTELQGVQKAFEKLGPNGVVEEGSLQLEAQKDDGLSNCAPSVQYAIRRLIRGVSSSRECARQGFALGLTILVGTVSSIKVDSLMKLIADLLEISSKGQEARDCLLGRLFAYAALERSGRIAKEWISDKDTPNIKEFTRLVISLAGKKRYLQEPAVSVIVDLVEKLPEEALLSQVLEAPGMQEWFHEASEAGNPDALLLALKIREKMSTDNKIFDKLLPFPYTPNKMFTTDHLTSLVPCFKGSTFCQPRVHSIWPVLVNNLLPDAATQGEDATRGLTSSKKHKKARKSNSSEEDIMKNLQCFCEIVIEGSLLFSSHDRKNLAFEVLLLILPRLPASFVQIVLSHRLVHCLTDILSTKDSWLYKAAQHFLEEIVNWARNDDDRRVAVIVALQKHSRGRFDCMTRTRIVKDLVGEFSTEKGCLLFVQNLVSMFVDEGHAADEPSDQSQTTDDNSDMGSTEDKDFATTVNPDSLKSWVIDSLPRVLKDLKLDPGSKLLVQKEIMKFLAVQGLFSACLGTEVTSFELQEKFKWPKAATSNELCCMCIEQLQLLLANAQKGEVSSASTNGLEPNDLGSYIMRFLGTLRSIPSVSLFRVLSDEDEKAFKKLQAMETQLYREERNMGPGTIANKLHALRYLLIQLLLQVLLRPGEFHEAATELLVCCKKAFSSTDLIESSEDEDNLDDDGVPELMDVLVDTILSLLPQSSPPVRSAIEQVFKCFCNEITSEGLFNMLRVIKKDLKRPRHRGMGSEDEDDEDDEDFLDIDETEELDEAETIKSGDDDDEADDSEALAAIEVPGGELSENSDDSDGGLDDDAMFRMDSYLAQMFKERKNQAGGKNQAGSESANSQLLHFKLRVLSLLETYLQENPGKPAVLTVYSYLAPAFVNPHTGEGSEQLGQRIWGILQKKIFKAKEYPKGGDIPFSTLESLLKKNLRLASKPFKKKSATNPSKKKQLAVIARQKMVGSLAQQSTHWILKIMHAREDNESEAQAVLNAFQSVLTDYFESKKSRLKPGFLKEAFQRQPWIGHRLFPFLVEKCGSAKFEFRCINALDVVEGILKSLVSSKSNREDDKDASLELVKAQMSSLGNLISKLVSNMPKKQAWRSQVRKFCCQTFKVMSTLNLVNEVLDVINEEACSACESQLGELFPSSKKKAEG